MGFNPLGTILVLGLILVSQLWEGVQCQGYSIDAPRTVSVQEGLCIVVHCKFTYPKSDPKFTNKELHGYWQEDRWNRQYYLAFATNDERKEIVPGARGRFRLSENLEEGDCSLFITDAQPSDQKDYFFRMEKGAGYNFFPPTSVRVEEAQNVIITESRIVPFLLGLSLVKVVFCFPIFSFVVWFSNRRKPPVIREEPSK